MRVGVRGLAKGAAGLALLAAAHGASLASGRDAAIEVAVDESVRSWLPVFNCMVLEPESHGLQVKFWQEDRAELLAMLAKENVGQEARDRIAAKTDPAALETMTKGSAQELIAYCRAHGDWMRNHNEFRILPLTMSIKRVLEAP